MEFEQLVSQYSNMIHAIIHSLHIYKNHEDFFQVGLIALWEGSQRCNDQTETLSPYLFKYVRGKILNLLMKEKNWQDQCFTIENVHLISSPNLDQALEQEILLSYFKRLTDMQQKWVIQHFLYGLSNTDIAEIEKVHVDKVHSCGRLAMKKFVGVG